MQLNLHKLGDYIEQSDRKNTDKLVTLLRGISTSKKFIESKANMKGVDISKYKVVGSREFAYVADTSRRGDKIALAFNDGDECIISSIYTAFRVKDSSKLMPEFLFIWFNRGEFDRYARYHSWGSARETFDWDAMCNVRLPIPSIEEQKKYVVLYNSLVTNQRCYEDSIDDLRLISNTFLEGLIKKGNRSKLGNYIQKSSLKNSSLSILNLRGISTSKKFIESKANTTGVNFANYRIVKKEQFAYVADTSRRGNKIALAFNSNEPCIISNIYTVFEVKKESDLIPEYLYLWFSRPEFDRYARYHSWGSARETFDWEDMCDVTLPIPSIKEQESIVAIHRALESRIKINEELKAVIKPLCPLLMQDVLTKMDNQGA